MLILIHIEYFLRILAWAQKYFAFLPGYFTYEGVSPIPQHHVVKRSEKDKPNYAKSLTLYIQWLMQILMGKDYLKQWRPQLQSST